MEFWDSFEAFIEIITKVGKPTRGLNTDTFQVSNPVSGIEKLRDWAFNKKNTKDWNAYDLSFIPNEKLRVKLESCLQEGTKSNPTGYFLYLYYNRYDFEDCFVSNNIRDSRWNLEPLLSEVAVSSNSNELNRLKAELVAKDNEIAELKKQLEKDNESEDWTKGSIVSLMEAVVYD